MDVLVPYTFGVLDALGIKHGPSHGEVMLTNTGPCLVEMNCRTHGGDGSWVPLARGLTGGYCQVRAAVEQEGTKSLAHLVNARLLYGRQCATNAHVAATGRALQPAQTAPS